MQNRFVRAGFDPKLSARIVSRRELVYQDVDPAADQPAFVRAASGIAQFGDVLAIVQDDTSFIALLNPATRSVRALALPPDETGQRQFDVSRGNKKQKLDLENCFVVDDTLIAFGSGSHPRREHIVMVRRVGATYTTRVVPARSLYQALRERTDFAGSELNIEGAVRLEERVRIFQRGNGAAARDLQPQNATLDFELRALLAYLEAPDGSDMPIFHDVVRYELGTCEDVPLTFTDATAWRDGDVLYVASAEASPNAVDDGQVVGATLGMIAADRSARYGVLLGEDGQLCRDKVEGIVTDPAREDRLLGVIDPDDHTLPAQLIEIAIDLTA